jgi:CRISPR-associated protein Cas2
MTYRIMRLVVLFDLPTTTLKERRAATQFRNSLIRDGFNMLQYSVYSRVCANHDVYLKHLQRVKHHVPGDGSVRVVAITENQFTNMHVVVGEKTANERKLPANQMTFF